MNKKFLIGVLVGAVATKVSENETVRAYLSGGWNWAKSKINNVIGNNASEEEKIPNPEEPEVEK